MQIKDFLIINFGLNSLAADNMSPTGAKMLLNYFFHDVWSWLIVWKKHCNWWWTLWNGIL
jgi:hypothetical protein